MRALSLLAALSRTSLPIRIYPIELGHAKRFANRGIPRLAPGPQARSILERLQELSKPFGTAITIENDVGVISLRPSAGDLDDEFDALEVTVAGPQV